MIIGFRYSSARVDDADIDAVEEQFGFRFPAEIRDIYKRSNGGRPVPDRYVGVGGTEIVDTFLPIKNSTATLSTMERSIQRVKISRQLLPDHLIPFAVDPFGSYFCFSLREPEFGAIYIFRMDRCEEPQRAAKFLAASISDFLSQLSTKQ